MTSRMITILQIFAACLALIAADRANTETQPEPAERTEMIVYRGAEEFTIYPCATDEAEGTACFYDAPTRDNGRGTPFVFLPVEYLKWQGHSSDIRA